MCAHSHETCLCFHSPPAVVAHVHNLLRPHVQRFARQLENHWVWLLGANLLWDMQPARVITVRFVCFNHPLVGQSIGRQAHFREILIAILTADMKMASKSLSSCMAARSGRSRVSKLDTTASRTPAHLGLRLGNMSHTAPSACDCVTTCLNSSLADRGLLPSGAHLRLEAEKVLPLPAAQPAMPRAAQSTGRSPHATSRRSSPSTLQQCGACNVTMQLNHAVVPISSMASDRGAVPRWSSSPEVATVVDVSSACGAPRRVVSPAAVSRAVCKPVG